MRSQAAAIAWEFRRRHRWGIVAIAAYLVAIAIVKVIGLRFEFNDETFALFVAVPLTSMALYFMAVFSFGLSGDLAARQSIYPARMFTLPVPTAALAGWPMLFGCASIAMMWFATRFLGMWPARLEVPIVWPALLGASLLAWTQALTWMPYALPGVRVVVTVLWLMMIDTVVMIALDVKAPEWMMLAFLGPQIPIAYAVARFAVGRARRGDVPDWRPRTVSRRGPVAAFRSAARAQTWFEWRQYGRSLPAMVAIVLPLELALLFLFRGTPALVYETLAIVLTTPPLMAVFVAATVRQPNSPFTSTRPLTSASLTAAKLKAAMLSTFAAWLLVLIAAPIALQLSETLPLVMQRAYRLAEVMGTTRAVAIVLLALFLLMSSTWKQLVQSLYIGLSGREWVVKASTFGVLALLAFALPAAHWLLGNRRAMAALWTSFPWIAAALAIAKLSIAGWIAVRLRDRGLLSERRVAIGAICFDLFVLALYTLLVWIFPALLIHRYVLALVAILAIPIARISAAPLALAWNRHR
jgi:hypothetical protein